MHQRSRVSYLIIPCPGIDCCKYYKPGEANHEQQHTISKVIYEDESSSSTASRNKFIQSGTFLDNLAPVPFDSKVDPPCSSACFNCWRLNHFLGDCYVKKRYFFCSNCGRRNVEIENCPRCAKAYCEYIEEEEHIRAKIELYGKQNSFPLYERKKEVNYEPKKSENCPQSRDNGKKLAASITPSGKGEGKGASLAKYKDMQCKKDHKNAFISIVEDFNKVNLNPIDDEQVAFSSSFQMDVNEKEKNYDNCTESNTVDTSTKMCDATEYGNLEEVEDKQKTLYSSFLTNQLENGDEDYNDIIVDEDEKSVIAADTGDTLQRFLDLLGTIKHLPIEAQNVAVFCFVNSQKKQYQM